MRVYSRITFDLESGRVLEFEGYEYDGPVAQCGGGPSQEQKDAAAAQASNSAAEAAIAQQANQRQTDAYNAVLPYATNLKDNGLANYGDLADYAGGNTAKAYAPARAQLNRQLSSIGSLPSGFKTSQIADLNEQEAQQYDQSLAQTQAQQAAAKQAGADMIAGNQTTYDPTKAYSVTNSANTSIMNAPLQSPGWQGVVGGITGGLASSLGKRIPF